jgi:hypothetical protein
MRQHHGLYLCLWSTFAVPSVHLYLCLWRTLAVKSSWNVMAHGDAREGKWRGNWRMEFVTSTLHTTPEHYVSSITTADEDTSATSSRLNWRPRRFRWTRPFRWKTKSGFCACAITFQTQSSFSTPIPAPVTHTCSTFSTPVPAPVTHTCSTFSTPVPAPVTHTYSTFSTPVPAPVTHTCSTFSTPIPAPVTHTYSTFSTPLPVPVTHTYSTFYTPIPHTSDRTNPDELWATWKRETSQYFIYIV